MTKVLILGASGMIGNTMFRFLSGSSGLSVCGTVRSTAIFASLSESLHGEIISGVDVENFDSLSHSIAKSKPDVVINCVGVVKQSVDASSPLVAVPLNTLLPHRLARLCEIARARLIHISSDCIFSGASGNYSEEDIADADDLYGRSKYLGEVNYPHAITLRTSTIGREIAGHSHGLLAWFLQQTGSVKGYRRAIFSGLATVELARVVRDFVIPNLQLSGLYHVSADAISKYDLLCLIAKEYKKSITVVPDDNLVLDRSLNSTKFKRATGYIPPTWERLIEQMHLFD